ncbi:hypothetical protein V2J09_000321 [Rumex salicifolius]
MDPCPFARLIVESLALKLPTTARSAAGSSGVHPTTTPCYCKITFKSFPSQTAPLPLISGDGTGSPPPADSSASAAGFLLDAAALQRISLSASPAVVRVSVYAGRMAACGGRKAIGSVEVKMDLSGAEATATVYQSGWISLAGKKAAAAARIHVVVRSEPDPRFVFQFGGEPECSPVVYQVQGKCNVIRQPVFSCKFTAERNTRSRSLPSGFEVKQRGWIRRTLSGDRENRPSRDRKGWMAMIYDLSGSAVAAASIITPFVPSPGSDSVSRSNPGAWLILRPSASGVDSWKPWGRLEAWRERWGPAHGLGYRFVLVTDDVAGAGPVIAEGSVSAKGGGEFRIGGEGLVMGSTVEGEGKESRPVVTVGAHHVTCMADVALFVALAAAVDLSMDACRLFSRRLRKELCSSDHHQSD